MSLYQLGIEGTIEEEIICCLFLPTKVPVACIANNIAFLIYNCPRDGDNPSYGDQSEYGKHPVDGGCPKNYEVLRIWTILGMLTILGIMTALGTGDGNTPRTCLATLYYVALPRIMMKFSAEILLC